MRDGVFAYAWNLIGDSGAATRFAELGVTRSPAKRRTTRSEPPPRGADVQRGDYERGEASNRDLTEFVP